MSAEIPEFDAKVASVERTIRRAPKTFTRTEGSDGITRIALVERRSA